MSSRRSLLNIGRLIDQSAGREVPVATSFLQDLNMCVEKMSVTTGKPSPSYKPSSLHCIRNMYYQCIEADVDSFSNNADSVGISESGTDRHLRIQNYVSKMKEYGVDCEYVNVAQYIEENNISDLEVLSQKTFETKLYSPKYNLRFLADGIIKYLGKYYILEIKTESSYKWLQRGGVDPNHFYQAYTYSLCLGLDRVIFLYENRDCCTKKCYLLEVSDDNRQFIVDKINRCNEYIQNRIVPPKPEDIEKKVCQYCGYRKTCRGDK